MDDPLFPSGSLDMVFMVNTYHHLARPLVLLKNLIPSLKPEAIVAVVELDPEKSGAEFRNESTSQEALRKQVDDAGYEVVRIETFLEKDNIFILRVKKP